MHGDRLQGSLSAITFLIPASSAWHRKLQSRTVQKLYNVYMENSCLEMENFSLTLYAGEDDMCLISDG